MPDRAGPTGPTGRTDPTDATDATEATDAADPSDPTDPTDRASRDGRRRHWLRWRATYGSTPAHLVLLLVSFLIAGYAVLRWLDSPSAVRLVVWFAGAVIGHDFVLFPLYSLLDPVLRRGTHRRRSFRVPVVNHIRVPVLLAGLLLLMWFPIIFRRPEPAYRAATGLDLSPYLARWLAVTAVLFGASALIYVVRLLRSPRRVAAANSVTPASKPTTADQPSS